MSLQETFLMFVRSSPANEKIKTDVLGLEFQVWGLLGHVTQSPVCSNCGIKFTFLFCESWGFILVTIYSSDNLLI